MHPRNRYQGHYDFEQLVAVCAELAKYVAVNKYGTQTIDFFNPEAVKTLNKALLCHYYGIDYWDIPRGYLCPPIPGRADYIHSVADLLSSNGIVPRGSTVHAIDIGVGANCIYPLIGRSEYGWSFVGTDIDPVSIESAKKIVSANSTLAQGIELRLQSNHQDMFRSVIGPDEHFDISICNPPFHSSPEDAARGSLRKLRNLTGKRVSCPVLNFAGQSNELWCEGGEQQFLHNMIAQSKEFASNVRWFSSLVSNDSNIGRIHTALQRIAAREVRTIDMAQGNKTSRLVAWRF